ncbi:hypothetical protein [Parasegetibacter sp. NRK P23]|uniref:hypothetical protein n=1 Tax=Parasegetibacter sp. NRK P23 TaxID=2942999 RepID=UPI0020430804|nr:hypothetical protein [Parasegetibacter sp. NRK P23]MCM5528573.1 hypothetical protein [Parasegetibacter sp. NRK P23]
MRKRIQKSGHILLCFLVLSMSKFVRGQEHGDSTVIRTDTTYHPVFLDTALRIRNLNPYVTLHVDSTLTYQFEINKNDGKYFWFLRNSPVGLKINKDNGTLSFKAEKSFFLSGKLKYDYDYRVNIGVQNLSNPEERIDTVFTLVFYNTEIIPSRVKPNVNNTLYVDEGDTINFKVQCDIGSFPIEQITMLSNIPLKNYTVVKQCDDDFIWSPPYDFIKDNEKEKEKTLLLYFVGSNKFRARDTAIIKIVVKDALNYPLALQEYEYVRKNLSSYVLQLKYTFLQMDKRLKKTKGTRTTFELSSAATALGGTVFSSLPTDGQKTAGKILPGVGVAMVPVKESVAPTKQAEQNSAAVVRSSIKRLEYNLQNNSLLGEEDPDINTKAQNMRNEMKQIQVQLVDVPIDIAIGMTEEELNQYFNSPKVNKKYKMKKR